MAAINRVLRLGNEVPLPIGIAIGDRYVIEDLLVNAKSSDGSTTLLSLMFLLSLAASIWYHDDLRADRVLHIIYLGIRHVL